MRFDHLVKEIISESLDNPYPFKHSEKLNGYVFYPDPSNQNVYYVVYTLRDPNYPPRLEIIFDYTDLDKDIEGTTDMTKTGDSFRIMATVKAIVKYHIENQGPNTFNIIKFSAKTMEHGKIALYGRLAQIMKKSLGPKWDLDVFRDKTQVIFELSREA